MSPWGGLHVGGDSRAGTIDRNADGSAGGKITSDTFVLGLTGGGRFHVFDRVGRETLDPALVLFGRAWVGFQDGRVTEYQTSQGPASGNMSPLRYEFAVDTSMELAVSKKILLSAGVGVNWIFANPATLIYVDKGSSTVAVSAKYAGYETFSRFGVGIRF